MSSAHGDWLLDRIADAKRWLHCEEECDDEDSGNPFDCDQIGECLFYKCEEFEQEIRDLKKKLGVYEEREE